MRGTFSLAIVVCALLAGCDQNSKSNDVTVKGKDGSVTISANGQNFTMKASDEKNGNFTMSGNGNHFTIKASDGKQNVEINTTGGDTNARLPDYVAVYPGGKVRSTTIDASKNGNSGTVSFETTASPAIVIAWYRQKSANEGLSKAVDMNMGGTTMFTANADGGRKTLQVIAAASGSGAQVQVNWSAGK
jgi:VCBS repeat-containing protein